MSIISNEGNGVLDLEVLQGIELQTCPLLAGVLSASSAVTLGLKLLKLLSDWNLSAWQSPARKTLWHAGKISPFWTGLALAGVTVLLINNGNIGQWSIINLIQVIYIDDGCHIADSDTAPLVCLGLFDWEIDMDVVFLGMKFSFSRTNDQNLGWTWKILVGWQLQYRAGGHLIKHI